MLCHYCAILMVFAGAWISSCGCHGDGCFMLPWGNQSLLVVAMAIEGWIWVLLLPWCYGITRAVWCCHGVMVSPGLCGVAMVLPWLLLSRSAVAFLVRGLIFQCSTAYSRLPKIPCVVIHKLVHWEQRILPFPLLHSITLIITPMHFLICCQWACVKKIQIHIDWSLVSFILTHWCDADGLTHCPPAGV